MGVHFEDVEEEEGCGTSMTAYRRALVTVGAYEPPKLVWMSGHGCFQAVDRLTPPEGASTNEARDNITLNWYTHELQK